MSLTQLASPLRADAPTSPLTIHEGGVDVASMQLPESAHNSAYRNPDDYEPLGTFDFVLNIIARYRIEHVTVDLLRGTTNMFVFAHLDIDDDDSFQIFEEDFPAGYFFNGTGDHFKISPTFHDLPKKLEGPIYANVIGFCMPNVPFRISNMTMLAHELTISVKTVRGGAGSGSHAGAGSGSDAGTSGTTYTFAAVPKPAFPSLVKLHDAGSIVYFQDTYGLCKFDLRLPDGTGTFIFRDTNVTKESPLLAFQMIFSKPADIPPVESMSLNSFDRKFGVFLEPPLKWNEVKDVSMWKNVVTVCTKAFMDLTKINILPVQTGVHISETAENSFKLTSKRIDGVDTNIFSTDLRYMSSEHPYESLVSGMEDMLAFLKTVKLGPYVNHLLGDFSEPSSGAGAGASASSSSSKRILDDDDDEDEALCAYGPSRKKRKSGPFYDRASFKTWFVSKFHTFGAVGGRGGCKRGEEYEAQKREKLEEKIEELRKSATKYMEDDEYDKFVQDTRNTFGM